MTDITDLPSLYSVTGDIKDINTLLIGRAEAVRLNAQAVPCDSILREAMQKIADLDTPTNIVDVMDPVAREAVDIAQVALSAAPAAPQPAQQPLTDEHKAILKECRNQAMKWTAYARIPEVGAFGGIAQDLDYLCAQLGVKND